MPWLIGVDVGCGHVGEALELGHLGSKIKQQGCAGVVGHHDLRDRLIKSDACCAVDDEVHLPGLQRSISLTIEAHRECSVCLMSEISWDDVMEF